MIMHTKLQPYLKDELRTPKSYLVYMINDDYTSWDFCIRVITTVFHKSVQEADEITNDIHTKGKGLCGIFSFEVAETKAAIVKDQAREEGFPMHCVLEEV